MNMKDSWNLARLNSSLRSENETLKKKNETLTKQVNDIRSMIPLISYCESCPMSHTCNTGNYANVNGCFDILLQGFRNGDFVLHMTEAEVNEMIEEDDNVASLEQDEDGNSILTLSDGRTIYEPGEIEEWIQNNAGAIEDEGNLPQDESNDSGVSSNSLFDSELSI